MSRKELEKAVIDKLKTDMIFCFELDEEEQSKTISDISILSDDVLFKYLEK